MSPRTATPETALASLAAVALNRAADGKAPEWIQILPAGERLQGRDGRSWLNDLPGVLSAFNRHGQPIAFDYEHGQDILAKAGQEAPAALWIEEMQERDGALWGRADWTPRGRAAVETKEYRYLSPAFTFDRSTSRITAVVGGGLVNRPNFVMAALARHSPEETPSMKTMALALGLPEAATEGECLMALAAQKAEHATAMARAATPDLARFVPRADLEAALNRAGSAETELRDLKAAGHGKSAAEAVDGAIADGKIAPSSRDYYIATCGTEAGLVAFKTHAAGLKSLFAPSILDDRRAGDIAGAAVALNAEQKAAALAMGIDEGKFSAFLVERAKKAQG